LLDYGLEENDIIAINALIDIILYKMGKDTLKLNETLEVINDLSSYSNLRLGKTNLGKDINNILNNEDLENIQNYLNSLNKVSSINNFGNLNNRKQIVLCDSIY
jgi:hypothetical protein